jgi:hypothetical protein
MMCNELKTESNVDVATQVSSRTLSEAAVANDGAAEVAEDDFAVDLGFKKSQVAYQSPAVLLVNESAAEAIHLPPDDAASTGSELDWEQVQAIGCAIGHDVVCDVAGAYKKSHGRDAASC